ncbi:hypothetical protein H2198_002175 [Neophaeococcomyces mojaviensis]|uniref:Uncharacterized protein n=1 Tax=Neophaeococcomyces mojaviensis TaxID=3383035 RepID=A0ACC3AEU0_9EURO|nr:hypothetical protein H2198_002175 [Knufia sp. JES_112]
MFTSSLPLLLPPAASLLPPLHDQPTTDVSPVAAGPNSLQAQQQQQQRRTRGHPHAMYPRSQLAILAHDERVITQRKLAIAMYGYSWLKPAGCTKTMLGRREEEIEREEVERQLREVELQERNAAEIEEAERQAQLDQQRASEAQGGDIGEDGERDLDEDVPDMDDVEGDEFEDEESEEEDDEDDEDLDNDIPEADTAWTYDTTRDPDTESEDEVSSPPLMQQRPPQVQARATIPGSGHYSTAEDQEQAEQEAIANTMLYEDELGEYDQSRDLDDELPDMDGTRNLDDDVPEAEDDDGGWEHTDTELEESDMDISIMPPGATAHHVSMPPPFSNIGQRQRRDLARQSIASQQSDMSTDMRRTSGNVQLPMPQSSRPIPPQTGVRGLVRSQQLLPNFTPDQLGSDFSVSALISTGNTDMSSIGANPAHQAGRGFLDPASARRNLFGAGRSEQPPAQATGSSRSFTSQEQISMMGSVPNLAPHQIAAMGSATMAPRQVSSGGLFTPSPQQQNVQRVQQGLGSVDEPRSRTRSGRVPGGTRGARR